MNTDNISALTEQLHSLGFENAEYPLLKRISFMPEFFSLSQKTQRYNDRLSFQLFFKYDARADLYILLYYDAFLQKETPLIKASINGVDTASLEEQLKQIDWKNAFDFSIIKHLNLKDKTSWENEMKIESVIKDLSVLEKSEEGKLVSVELKIKYWSGTSYQEVFRNISPLKSKSEVSQRFYLSEAQRGISVDEAHRFLQNRWWEKQMQAKKKQTDSTATNETENNSHALSGRQLLKKKDLAKFRTVKPGKAVVKGISISAVENGKQGD